MSDQVEMVTKVTLSSGKVVLLKNMKIRHYEVAVKAAGMKAGNNQMLAAWLVQQELLKMLIAQVNGQDVPKAQLESLDDHFTSLEYKELMSVVDQLAGAGGADAAGPKIEVVSFGSK